MDEFDFSVASSLTISRFSDSINEDDTISTLLFFPSLIAIEGSSNIQTAVVYLQRPVTYPLLPAILMWERHKTYIQSKVYGSGMNTVSM